MIHLISSLNAWQIAMLAIVPLVFAVKAERLTRSRVWLVLLAASLSTMLHQSLQFYIALDFLAAFLILRPPRTVWQKIIGLGCLAMALMALGNFINQVSGMGGVLMAFGASERLISTMHAIAWAQLVILLFWSGGEQIAGNILHRLSSDRGRTDTARGRV